MLVWVAGIVFALACNFGMQVAPAPENIPADVSASETSSAGQNPPPAQTLSAIPTFSPIPTFTLSPTPTLTPTQALVFQGPETVTVPILLYHHIEAPRYSSYYYLPPGQFEAQMKLLHDWGYVTITLELLVKSIRDGAFLPARPIVITFDDGQASVYATAFPIMERYGFKGVVYAVGKYVDAETFMTTEQLKDLAAAGWEIGSHGMTHKDLTTLNLDGQHYEIFNSRELLSEKIGVPVTSFAYPWGAANDTSFTYVHNAGYTSAMGLGYSNSQRLWNIYLLQRRDVTSDYDLPKFASFLPWYGDESFFPTITPGPSPTPSRTPKPTKKP